MYGIILGKAIYPFYESVIRRRKTWQYLGAAERQQWLSPDAIADLQAQRLRALLQHAASHVPFYRARLASSGCDVVAHDIFDSLSRVPLLTKREIQDNAADLLAENYSSVRLFNSWTGGSTGQMLKFCYDHDTYERRVASTARVDRWAGWDFGARELYIWGGRPKDASRIKKWKQRLHHTILRRRTINCYLLSDNNIGSYVTMFNRFRPQVVIAYTSALYNFVVLAQKNGLSCRPPRGIIASAEQLFPHQRALIEDVMQAPVFNRYGSREFMNIAMECSHHHGLHVNADNLYVEILKDGRAAAPGELGEVVITDLNNYAMPFIRYRIGDLAVASAARCPCGRGLPLIHEIAGRTFDALVTENNQCVTGLFFTRLMNEFAGVRHFQVIQKRRDTLHVKIVRNEHYRDTDTTAITDEIQKLMGRSMQVHCDFVEDIPLQASGKRRLTISEVDHAFNRQ